MEEQRRIAVEDADDVRIIRLARPDRRNAIDMPCATQLADAFEGGRDAAAIVLTAEGSNFCVGGDISVFAAAVDVHSVVNQLANELHRAVRAMIVGPPVVVAVSGWAAGAGMSIALAADVVVASDSARFRAAYPGIGLSPDGGMSWTLPRVVGFRRATALILENRQLDASTAQSLGIVDHVVGVDDVADTAIAIARNFADGPRSALMAIKLLVSGSGQHSLADHLELESEQIATLATSDDGREGVAAFGERRLPVYGLRRLEP